MRRWLWRLVALVAVAGVVAYTVSGIKERQEQLGPPQPSKLVGVNVHPLWSGVGADSWDRMLDLAERSRSNVVRIDVGWSSLQPNGPGPFDEGYASRADAFIGAARKRGIRVIVTLLGTPCWASTAPESLRQGCTGRWFDREGITAYAPRQVNDFAAAAREVARRWGSQIDALEIWNEPNDPFFWRSADPAADYGVMLQAAYRAVKEVRPGLTVLGGGLAYADGDFLRELYERGSILGSYDAISIHPYTVGVLPTARRRRGQPRKQAFRSGIRWVRETMRRHGDRSPELWLTEVGASTCPGRAECVSEAEQAQYVEESVRLARRWPFVKAIVVYSLLDDGADDSKVSNRFGLASVDGRPKPAFRAFRDAAGAG